MPKEWTPTSTLTTLGVTPRTFLLEVKKHPSTLHYLAALSEPHSLLLLLRSFLEKRVGEMEQQRELELKMVQLEKEQLQTIIEGQAAIVGELQRQLHHVSSNNTALQHQQQELLDTVNNLVHTLSTGPVGGGYAARQRGLRKNMFSLTLFTRLSR